MNRNKSLFLLSVIILLVQGCATTSSFQVTRVGEEPAETTGKVVYVLPQTLFYVTVDFEKETFIPGPYRIFTQKYLGMKPYVDEASFSYRITNVDVRTGTEPDPDQYYSINTLEGNPDFQAFLELGKEGLVLDPLHLYDFENYARKSGIQPGGPYFTDLSVKRNLQEITDTLYKTMITDSSYVRIPVVRKQREAKTLEQKAEEAANFIIKIRKRRFKLLAGQYDVFPEGDALAISVKELDKLEKEYLELFLGKTVKQEFTRSFIVVPNASGKSQSVAFAAFSQQLGLNTAGSKAGSDIVMEIKPLDKVRQLRVESDKYPDLQMRNNLFYRVPDMADISVKIASDILYESRVSIYQAGAMVNLPIQQDSGSGR